MVTLQGESQADHIRTKPNGDKKETEVVSKRWHNLFLCAKPRLSQARTLLLSGIYLFIFL